MNLGPIVDVGSSTCFLFSFFFIAPCFVFLTLVFIVGIRQTGLDMSQSSFDMVH